MTTTVAIYAPLRPGVPYPKTVRVPAGDYRTYAERYGSIAGNGPPSVRVAEQEGRVVGCWECPSDGKLVLNVEVRAERIR